MTKKVFFIIFLFFFFALAFPLPVLALDLEYDVGPNAEDYVWPHSQHRWRTIITNGTSVLVSGRLDATYEAAKYSSVDQGDWVKEGGGLRYDYSLGPFGSKTIDWFGTLVGSDSECRQINDVTSRLFNNGSLVATEEGTVLASVYLTLTNQTVDSITVSTYVNGSFNDTRSLSPGGSSGFRITAGGVDGGGSLFSCSRPFSYSFTVTGVAGATYSCSVPSTALTNNCTSEHTATCTKTTTGPTPTLPPGVPSPTPVPPTTSPPLECNFSDCGAYGCGSKQRWVSGNCWSYSWFGGDGCYNDDSCSDPIDCKPKYCHLLDDSQSGFECGETFNSWKPPGGSASQIDDRYDHGVQTGQWSLRVRYTGAADTPYYSAYTVEPSAPSSSQQAKFYGKYYVLENTVGKAATLKACVQYFSNWPSGYLGQDCVDLNASLSTVWLDFEITSSYRPGANQVLPKFDVAGSPGRVRYHADSLCLQFVSGPTPTPLIPGNICGYIKNPLGGAIPNYTVTVYNNDPPQTVQVTTDANGKFSTAAGFAQNGDFYAVRPFSAPPALYVGPAKSISSGWNWNYCVNPTPGTLPWADTPLGSGSYECQKFGSGIDCAGPDGTGTICRCSFKFDYAPTPTPPGDYTIAGRVTDVTKTKGIAGVRIEVYNWTTGKRREPVTDSNGYWSVNGFVKTGHLYKVRVTGNDYPQTAPPGYDSPARTNEKGWNWDFNTGGDTPLGSLSYLYQIAGSNDCAGPNGDKVSRRCSFSYTPSSPLPTPTPPFIPTPTPRPVVSWFQTTGGDIQAKFDITSRIPACATNKNLSLTGTGGTTGVVGYGDSLTVAPEGVVSWQAKTTIAGPTIGFEYLANRLKVNRTDNLGIGDIDISSLADGVYYSSESRNILGSFPGGKKIVIYIEGTANIRSNLVVPAGSFLAIIASGDLTFSSAVIQAQGFFLADGTLEINESSEQFIGQGSFVGLGLEGSGGISFLRDLVNNCSPAEAFIERPDFYINAPNSFKLTNSYFKEIEP